MIRSSPKPATPAAIHLGFEMGTARQIAIPLRHMAVTGQTQESGKTTTLEALISRSKLRALAFVTKRGESSFTVGERIPPYFRDDAGGRPYWEFVESIVASTMGQRMRFERAWIVKAAKGASSLQQVRDNITRLQGASKRSMDQDLYMLLGEYLDIVLPQLSRLPPRRPLQLRAGLSVMDLTSFTEEMQMLIVRSCVLCIHENERGVVTIMPEAWKFIPESRMTPVKPAAERLIREGAGLQNFVWMDSQDIAGVWKLMLRAATVWIIGVQREANEIKRTLANIPGGFKKPVAADVATLEKGEFFACFGKEIHRVYVQPQWLSDDDAIAVAEGHLSASVITAPAAEGEGMAYDEDKARLERENLDLRQRVEVLTEQLRSASGVTGGSGTLLGSGDGKTFAIAESFSSERFDRLYTIVKERLIAEAPSLIRVLATKPQIDVVVERKAVQLDGSSLKGRVAKLIAKGFFKEERTQSAARSELKRTGPDVNTGNLSKAFSDFVADGFLTNEAGGYREVTGMKVNLVER